MYMTVTIIFSIAVLIIVVSIVHNLRRSHVVSEVSLDELVAQLRPVPEGITTLALQHLQPTASPMTLDDETVWTMIEGTQGLAAMKDNAQVLLAIASYAQRWDPARSIQFAEYMRRDALALRRAIVGIGLGVPGFHHSAQVQICIQEAASAYYLMRKRLLMLYEAHPLPSTFAA